jgi:NAD(P)-dependent dehydrogenase (short-subunit alcohol dehydrogenase family)
MINQATLIIGANSGIARALANQIVGDKHSQLIVVSRNITYYQQTLFNKATVLSVETYHEQEIQKAVTDIQNQVKHDITRVFICHGVLHNQRCHPEKRLDDFEPAAFMEIITANTITPIIWLKHLTQILTGKSSCKITIFTARVGSISDNKLGGWYSYRASKAALNMLIKSAAVELARRAKNIKIISFHPGTTNTALSKPFQKNVPKGKLFTSEFVASQLLDIVENTAVNGEASFIDWQGKIIPW